MAIKFRRAAEEDLEQITEIYNQGIDTTNTSFDDSHVNIEKFRCLITEVKKAVIVAVINDQIIGWSSINPYLRGSIQNFTCYGGTFIRTEFRDQQLGRNLLAKKFTLAKEMGYRSIIAEVFIENKASISMCVSQGYVKVGTINQVAKKGERWLDCLIFQKML